MYQYSKSDFVKAFRAEHQKATVSTNWSATFGDTSATMEFLDQVNDMEVLGRLPRIRRVPPRVRFFISTTGVLASFVEERGAIPVSAMTLTPDDMVPGKIGAIVPVTKEQMEDGGELLQTALQRDMSRALAEGTDFALLDTSNSGSGPEPAAITNGAPTISSIGDPTDDFYRLVETFPGDLTSSAFVMHPVTAMELGLSGLRAFEDVGARGGEILGLPVLTSRSVERESNGGMVALVDGSQIAVAEGPIRVEVSDKSMIQMSTTPADDLGGGMATAVSLFQAEALAIKIIRRVMWRRLRTDAVSVLTGAFYPPAS